MGGSLGFVFFVVGITIRLLSVTIDEKAHPFVRAASSDIGAFIVGAVAIPFVYEIFFRRDDEQEWHHRLDVLLDKKLASLGQGDARPRLHGHGRLTMSEKVALFQDAQREVIEVGVSLRTFVSYFDQRPACDFKEPVLELLRRGVTVHVALLDPASDAARVYAETRGEPRLGETIRRSLASLLALQDEVALLNAPGSVVVHLYHRLPFADIMMVDPETAEGRAYIAPYLPSGKRADNPVIEVRRRSDPAFFDAYHAAVVGLIAVVEDEQAVPVALAAPPDREQGKVGSHRTGGA